MDSETINFTETFPQSMQEALKASLKVFWRLGVHRTSIDDVCRQSGVSYHFLNENFESKEHLYRTAVMWYLDQYGRQLLSEFALHSNPTEALRGALYECIGLFCNKQCEHAKLLSYALAAVNNSDRILISELLSLRRKVYATILMKLNSNKTHLKDTADIPVLARFYITTLRGLASQAADGIPSDELYRVADLSLELLEAYRK
ncbi:Bacterial regulatory protein, tetR family [Pseudovibrio sp. Ad46]|uniref:TetR/AcrR family transcriptional regulator n=1 Tax=unclassified Pseudovibrio TaxID=2627060 RepID=UPI0007AE9EC3|nr:MULTISPECIES: TetR family transcriptional regulator [unclassified Pseudovibrio]KZK85468.1 Bacterial regulatory protein, tetR family [Pseudovibrio sp. Ad46]KZL02548.1 Bacterial regulatory protein, tetR family [Pseudovibrio sp. W74]KZL07909.1 Bacterial regulatory protein, tetR family [Pseudovibrio sp. Ad14]